MESLKNMYEEFGICDAIYEFGQKTEEKLKTRFDAIDKNAEYNQLKVDRKSTRLNSSHTDSSRMPSSA